MKISALIIDEESKSRQRLLYLTKEIPDLEVLDEVSTGKKGIEKINSLKPDLIFLKIKLKDMTGFEILEQIQRSKIPLTIFITDSDKYAIKAFDYGAFDYILEPYRDNRLQESVKRAVGYLKNKIFIDLENKLSNLLELIKIVEERKNTLQETKNFKIPIKLKNKTIFVDLNEIKYIIASGYYSEIHIEHKMYLLRESLTSLIDRLQSNNFIRIHRSTIINSDQIVELIQTSYGEIDIRTKDNKYFRISKSYKKEFQKVMGI
jgi:two-component system LytT family response regulator